MRLQFVWISGWYLSCNGCQSNAWTTICYLVVYRTKFWNLPADNSIIGWDILSTDISYDTFARENLKTPSAEKSGLQIMRENPYTSVAQCRLSEYMSSMKFNPWYLLFLFLYYRVYSLSIVLFLDLEIINVTTFYLVRQLCLFIYMIKICLYIFII